MKLLVLLFGLNAFADIQVLHVNGKVTYSGKPIHAQDSLKEGGLLDTGDAAGNYVDLAYPEGHRLRLKKKARMRLEKLDPVKGSKLELLAGQFFAHFVPGKSAEKIEVRTKAVIAGIRGTEYMLEEDPQKGTYLCVCDGKVNVHAISGKSEAMVSEGQDLWVTGDKFGVVKDSKGMAETTHAEFSSMGID